MTCGRLPAELDFSKFSSVLPGVLFAKPPAAVAAPQLLSRAGVDAAVAAAGFACICGCLNGRLTPPESIGTAAGVPFPSAHVSVCSPVAPARLCAWCLGMRQRTPGCSTLCSTVSGAPARRSGGVCSFTAATTCDTALPRPLYSSMIISCVHRSSGSKSHHGHLHAASQSRIINPRSIGANLAAAPTFWRDAKAKGFTEKVFGFMSSTYSTSSVKCDAAGRLVAASPDCAAPSAMKRLGGGSAGCRCPSEVGTEGNGGAAAFPVSLAPAAPATVTGAQCWRLLALSSGQSPKRAGKCRLPLLPSWACSQVHGLDVTAGAGSGFDGQELA